MLKRFKVLMIVLMAFGVATTETKADEPLMDGVKSFICDGPEGAGDEPIVLLDTDTGWLIPKEPTLKVAKINDGWRISGQELGFLGYLKQPASGAWSLDLLSNRGYEKYDCIDISDSVSEVITVIKPLLNDSILETQEALALANRKLTALEAQKKELAATAEAEKQKLMASFAAEKRQLKTEISFQKKQRLDSETRTAKLNNLYADLSAEAFKYAPTASFVLTQIKDMPITERNVFIDDSNLNTNNLDDAFFKICVQNLRQGNLHLGCRSKLVELVIKSDEFTEQKTCLNAQNEISLLKSQAVELRTQLDTLQDMLDSANPAVANSEVQIESLGKNLNTALARVAAEQRKVAVLNEQKFQLRKQLEKCEQ